MLEAAFYIAIGLFLGWIVFPQPQWVKDGWAKIKTLFTGSGKTSGFG